MATEWFACTCLTVALWQVGGNTPCSAEELQIQMEKPENAEFGL